MDDIVDMIFEDYASNQFPDQSGKLPVKKTSVDASVPIIPVSRWVKSSDRLKKRYEFMKQAQRDRFVNALLSYERNTKHNADITITEGAVLVVISTKNVGVTELDKEYAAFADTSYRDIVYCPL